MARWRKLGIIAGAGVLPRLLAEAAADAFVVRLAGVADDAFEAHSSVECGMAEAGRILRVLKESGCDAVTLAGVVRRPDFSKLMPDWRGAVLMPKVIAAAAKGDGALLDVLIETLETEGFVVVGAEEVLSSLSAPAGPLGSFSPGPRHWADIRKAAAVIAALGPFDVGQAAVVASGFTLAIEAAEGTDGVLARCASLPPSARGGEGRNGVLVKRPKPGQERRVDLPTVGVRTLAGVHAAGLAGVAVEAGAALVIDIDAVRREADRLGLFFYGFTPAELQ
ncbi:MAG: LpxI family protein [Parvularculaceae bacterium]